MLQRVYQTCGDWNAVYSIRGQERVVHFAQLTEPTPGQLEAAFEALEREYMQAAEALVGEEV